MTWAGEVELQQAANTPSAPAHFLWNSSARNIALFVCWVWKLSPKELCKLGKWVSGQAIGSTPFGRLQLRAVYNFLVCVSYQELNPEPDACEAAILSLSGIQAPGFVSLFTFYCEPDSYQVVQAGFELEALCPQLAKVPGLQAIVQSPGPGCRMKAHLSYCLSKIGNRVSPSTAPVRGRPRVSAPQSSSGL